MRRCLDTLHTLPPDHPPRWTISLILMASTSQDYFFKVRMQATSPLISSGFNLSAYFGILFLPFVMASVRSASDIFCTSAVVKSWAPIFFPIAEPVPSGPWHMAHFDLKRSALCACADRGRLRTTANAVAKINICISILFIFQAPFEFLLAQPENENATAH